MKLRDLRNLAKDIRNINIALILLGVGMVAAMCVWCVLFQSDVITTVQWVALELTTMVALSVTAFILNFFCDVNRDVRARLTKAIRKCKMQQQAKARDKAHAAAAMIATNAANAINNTDDSVSDPIPELQVVGG